MSNLDLLAVWYLAFFGFLVPFLVIRGRARVRAGVAIPPLKKRYLQTVAMELFFFAVAMFAAWNRGIPVFSRGILPARAVVLACVIFALGLGTLPLRWKFLSDEEKRRSLATRPQQTGDLGPWFAISLAAGVVEEIVYRGVMMTLLLPMTRNWWVSVAICVLFFALGHVNQPLRMVALVLAPLAVGLHLLVGWTGALYLAMATHFLYDFFAGVIYIRLIREYRSTSPAPASAAA